MPTKLITIGTFDVPHVGHHLFLEKCAEFVEVKADIIVGVNTDEFVTKYRGRPPLYAERERRHWLDKLGWRTVPNASAGKELILRHIVYNAPNSRLIVAIGSDWYEKDYWKQLGVERNFFGKHNINLVFIPYTQGISTSDIKRRLEA